MKTPRSVYIYRPSHGAGAALIRLDRKPTSRASVYKVFPASRSDDYIAGFCDAAGLQLVKNPEGGPR